MVIVFPPSLVFNAAVVGQTAERGKKAATNQPIGAWRKEREDYTIEKKKKTLQSGKSDPVPTISFSNTETGNRNKTKKAKEKN